jgi:hypothetical protein
MSHEIGKPTLRAVINFNSLSVPPALAASAQEHAHFPHVRRVTVVTADRYDDAVQEIIRLQYALADAEERADQNLTG